MNAEMAAHWRRCRPWIEAALEHAGGTHTVEDVAAQIAAGEAWFWPGERSALVTELLRYPLKTFGVLWLAGGDRKELMAMSPSVEAWARAMGCCGLIEMGRPGWARALKSLGYRPLYTAILKEFSP